MTVPELKSTVYLLPGMAWPIIKQNVANTRRSLIILITPYYFTQRGVFYSVTASLSEVMQNQSNSLIIFDTQLKTALQTFHVKRFGVIATLLQ